MEKCNEANLRDFVSIVAKKSNNTAKIIYGAFTEPRATPVAVILRPFWAGEIEPMSPILL